MATIKLTERSVSALPSPTDAPQAYYWDEELTGLGVVVGRTGTKTFVVSSPRWSTPALRSPSSRSPLVATAAAR